MSAYTTKRMTRSQVMELILREIPNMERNHLERIADMILEPSLYNCRIVADGFEDAH